MFDLFEKIEEALRELLTTFISSNLTTMFDSGIVADRHCADCRHDHNLCSLL